MKVEEEKIIVTPEQVKEISKKIEEGIKQKEGLGKKDKSLKVETKTGLYVRITRNVNENKFYLSIGPKGGHPVYNKVIFDSSEKIKEFILAMKTFIKEREDVILAIDFLNQGAPRKSGDSI